MTVSTDERKVEGALVVSFDIFFYFDVLLLVRKLLLFFKFTAAVKINTDLEIEW